jgi:hypothetical protein
LGQTIATVTFDGLGRVLSTNGDGTAQLTKSTSPIPTSPRRAVARGHQYDWPAPAASSSATPRWPRPTRQDAHDDSTRSKHAQAGGFLLEALIGVLIFSFGILGIVGLQAASLRHTGDSNTARSHLSGQFADFENVDRRSGSAQGEIRQHGRRAGYVTFKADGNLPGGRCQSPPIVLVDPAAPVPQSPSVQGHVVLVSVFWRTARRPAVQITRRPASSV